MPPFLLAIRPHPVPLPPPMSPLPLSPCLPIALLSPSLSGRWKESIKLPVQHLQHASFSFLRLLQLWGDRGPSWGIAAGAHGLKERARGSESRRCLFCQRQRPPIQPLHFPALSSPSDQRAALHMKGAAHSSAPISPAPPHQPPSALNKGARICSGADLTFWGGGLLCLFS